MRKNFIISKQSDIEGFSSFKCSLCGEEFKLNTNQVQEDDVIELFCPNCGIPSPIPAYYTTDIIEHAETIVMNEAMDMLNDLFKGFERTSKRNKNITFKRGKPLPIKQPRALFEKCNYIWKTPKTISYSQSQRVFKQNKTNCRGCFLFSNPDR
ncbi:hypothetical protein [Bacillus sp. Ba 3]|uniref:hypothetical protein n=1 Tax=Bacillus sp. Ba 3 TaxID=3397768 RepID=UPI0039E06694